MDKRHLTTLEICEQVFDLPFRYSRDTGPDYWQTPQETESYDIPRGDCEDYAIWVWDKLVEAGIDEHEIALYWHPWTPHQSHISTIVYDGESFLVLDVLGYSVYRITLEDIQEAHRDKWRFLTKESVGVPQWDDCKRRMSDG